MKKSLLFFAGILCSVFSFAQLQLSELYVRPGNNQQEYFEVVNSSPGTENTGCYYLVTYFREGSQRGLYVVTFPNVALAPRGTITASSQAPNFNYQGGISHADFSWNAAHINRYVFQGGALTLNNSGASYTDIFLSSNGGAGGGGSLYAVFLFKGSALADAFLGSWPNNTVPDFITGLGQLNASGGTCGPLQYNFANINSENAALFGHVNSEAGTNNGYYRNAIGGWGKSSAPAEQTPNAPNDVTGGGCPTDLQAFQLAPQCVSDSTIGFSLTAGDSRSFPATVRVYFDANGSQFLDDGDVLINTRYLQQANLNSPQTVAHTRGQEDFLIMIDGAGFCQDLISALNCPAAIILPVTLQSFSLQRSGATVSLRWSTLTEMNNRGFFIQRQLGNGSWANVAFVQTKAAGGNSTNVLSYSFSDLNNFRGISQYRLQQVDIDGRIRYSDVRSTRGDGSIAQLLVFPNPARSAATIQFATADRVRDVQVSDMAGRTVKQWIGSSSQSLQLSNLAPGVYTVRVTDAADGTQQTARLVVSGQ
ncbi:T9SS type A sorting domain-containing protein [Flaviaesturariibacter terrae]